MEELLRNAEYLEFFIEGQRTRSGKAVHPKGGLLAVVIDAFLNGSLYFIFIISDWLQTVISNLLLD